MIGGLRGFLVDRWFLVVLILGVASALTWPSPFVALTRDLPPHLVIALALVIMAWTMPSNRLRAELASPWAALWAITVSYTFLPGFAWLLGGLSPTPDLRVGLLLAASVPCTLASAILWTRMAGGNEATALCAVLGGTLASWFATTFWLVSTTGSQIALDGRRMMIDLALTLVVPVIVGQAMRAWSPLRVLADTRKTLLSAIAQIFVLSIVFKTAGQVGMRIQAEATSLTFVDLALAAILAQVTHVAALYVGLWSSRGLGFDRPRQIAVAFSGSQKTLPVSLFLFESYFQNEFPLAVIPLLFFHVGQLLLDTIIAERLKRTSSC